MAPSKRRRLGIMGGTFDPIHLGHLVCAEEALWQFSLDEVLWVPAGHPWQKPEEAVSPAEDRFQMLVLATSSHPRFSVSRVEMDRPGPTYTLETLNFLRDFYGELTELYFITGADAVLQILTWKDPEQLFAAAHFIAATRPNYELDEHSALQFGERVSIMTIPGLDISSTDLRKRVAEGRPIRYLVPEEVGAYIRNRGLYSDLGEQTA